MNVLLSNIGAWIINSEEILDFLRWAKEYNKFVDKKNKIHFTGYDIPINDPQSEIYIVLGYVRTNDPGSETDVKNKLGCINLTSEAYKYKTNEYKVECRAKIDGIIASFDNKKVEYLKSSSLEQYKFAEKSLKSLSQLELFYSELPEKAYALRDEFMYKNIIWIREVLDKKIVIWGHNTHIGKNNFYPSNSGTLGYFLQKELGKDYYALGSTFFAGSFNAIPLDVSHIADAPPDNSYETFFDTANIPEFFLSISNNPMPTWFSNSHCLRNIGAFYDDKKLATGWDIDILQNEFDGFIYIKNSTPTRLIKQ